MARESVAIDFIGLGERGHVGGGRMGSGARAGVIDEERVSRVATRLVRPIPSVPEHPHLATSTAQAMSRMSDQAGFRNWTDTRADVNAATNSPNFARPGGGAAGMCPPPWVNKHALAMRQIQEQSSSLATAEQVSRSHSVGHHSPSGGAAWDLHSSAPASPSHHTMSASNRVEVFAQQLAQQARKAASVFADPHHGLRNNAAMKTSPVTRVEAAHGNIQLSRPAEPCFVPHPHASSSTQSAGFGSPVPSPLYSRMEPSGNTGPVESGAAPQQQQRPQHELTVQEITMAAAHALASPPASGKQPQAAQLTIFYSGMVNVYDEVPYDKAQAIMLLAGKGSTMLSSNSVNVFGNSHGPVGLAAGSQPPSRAGSPAPHGTTSTSVGALPPGPVPTISNRQTPIVTGVELPQARKASLARFLERRKDRVRRPYTHRNNHELAVHEARMSLSRENSPSPSSSSGLPRRPLPRPDQAGNQSNLSLNAGQAAGASRSGAGAKSEPTSPKLPSPPRQRSTSQDRPSPDHVINPAPTSLPISEDKPAAMEINEHL